jgi:hypothetical protein
VNHVTEGALVFLLRLREMEATMPTVISSATRKATADSASGSHTHGLKATRYWAAKLALDRIEFEKIKEHAKAARVEYLRPGRGGHALGD